MKAFKYYNSYIGLVPRLLMYVGYPLLVGAFAMFQLGFMHYKWMISGVFCLTMVLTMMLFFCLDRWSIGPIFVKKGQGDELIKSSPRGREFLKKVLSLDIIFRFVVNLAVTLIIVAVTVISGFYDEYKIKIISSAVVYLLAVDGVCNLSMIICRLVDGQNEAVISLYGLEVAFVPAIVAIVIGKPVVSLTMAGIYLILDVMSIAMNIKKTGRLVNEEWYKD